MSKISDLKFDEHNFNSHTVKGIWKNYAKQYMEAK